MLLFDRHETRQRQLSVSDTHEKCTFEHFPASRFIFHKKEKKDRYFPQGTGWILDAVCQESCDTFRKYAMPCLNLGRCALRRQEEEAACQCAQTLSDRKMRSRSCLQRAAIVTSSEECPASWTPPPFEEVHLAGSYAQTNSG